MSRGPGRWQRVLLEVLEQYDVGVVAEIAYNHLKREPTRAELVAVRRAAAQLATASKLRALYLGRCPRCDELSETFTCRKCRAGCRHVLAVERVGSEAPLQSLSPMRIPSWVSVVTATSETEATLTEVA